MSKSAVRTEMGKVKFVCLSKYPVLGGTKLHLCPWGSVKLSKTVCHYKWKEEHRDCYTTYKQVGMIMILLTHRWGCL